MVVHWWDLSKSSLLVFQYSNSGCVRHLVTCLQFCARLPCALRWWMAADCSDSLGTRLVRCTPHNGLTHRESTLSCAESVSWSFYWKFLFDSFVAVVFGWRQQSSLWLYLFFFCTVLSFLQVGMDSFPAIPILSRYLVTPLSFVGCEAVIGSLAASFHLTCSHISIPPASPFERLQPVWFPNKPCHWL